MSHQQQAFQQTHKGLDAMCAKYTRNPQERHNALLHIRLQGLLQTSYAAAVLLRVPDTVLGPAVLQPLLHTD